MALEWGGKLCLPVACDDGIHDALEGGIGCSQGGKFPEKSLQDGWGHGKDLVEGGACCGPGEDGAPVAPCLHTGSGSSAEGCDDRSESLAHPRDSAGCGRSSKGGDHGGPVSG